MSHVTLPDHFYVMQLQIIWSNMESVVNSGLPICNQAQVSTNGPSVNWKFFTDMKKKVPDDLDTILINTGSCGLHIVHNSFKTGETAAEWNVEALLSSFQRFTFKAG